MSDFSPGQRWLSETETELGLGIVRAVDDRLIHIFFPACDEERTYARDNAPLSRVGFTPGEPIETARGRRLIVREVEESEDVLIYHAHPEDDPDAIEAVVESHLAHHLDLSAAGDRLLSRQLDSSGWFELRHAALQAREETLGSPVSGLAGPRVDLIGHQLFIAQEVSSRDRPRVLLADEVGLGKTIEAGLILHRLLHTGRIRRALILVPPALLHQWFVEMARRFNLHFSIFDHERLASLRAAMESTDEEPVPGGEEAAAPEDEDDPDAGKDVQQLIAEVMALDEKETEGSGEEATTEPTVPAKPDNPFLSEQLVLCTTELLEECDLEELAGGEWDMTVVDEAHHLEWNPEGESEAYRRVRELSARVEGLLLLTATPEQLGPEGHFARLHLLDPERFPDLGAFLDEQERYREVAELAGRLHDEPEWDAALKKEAARWLPDETISESRRTELLDELVDRFGPGRVMFRNTRRNIRGFPERQVHSEVLPCPDIHADTATDLTIPLEDRLHPERRFDDDSWCANDPRVDWLVRFLRRQRGEKVLVICADRDTAVDLEAWCGYRQGLSVTVFHEGMDLISRDRAAAWFAETEGGAQALICSEIGSEGRNFQFAHHLVLLDLPLNPDQLEQRIGRLDRIGQEGDIHIHVPYFGGHPQQVLFRWYQEGMDAFCHTNPAGGQILERTGELLGRALDEPDNETLATELVERTRQVAAEIHEKLETGRDRLLEMASHDPERSTALIERVQAFDEDSPLPFLEKVCERHGVMAEEHSDHALILKPGPHMQEPFPGLPEEGITVTDDRATALARDDMQFLTREHPLYTGALDMVLSGHRGKACVCLLKNPKLPAGTLLVEALYRLECPAPRHLHAERFLPEGMLRTLINVEGRDLSQTVTHEALSRQCQKMDKKLARKVVGSQKDLLRELLRGDHEIAAGRAQTLINQALAAMHAEQEHELNRLLQLREKNPEIPESEVQAIRERTAALERHLAEAHCQLDAVRVIVVGE